MEAPSWLRSLFCFIKPDIHNLFHSGGFVNPDKLQGLRAGEIPFIARPPYDEFVFRATKDLPAGSKISITIENGKVVNVQEG